MLRILVQVFIDIGPGLFGFLYGSIRTVMGTDEYFIEVLGIVHTIEKMTDRPSDDFFLIVGTDQNGKAFLRCRRLEMPSLEPKEKEEEKLWNKGNGDDDNHDQIDIEEYRKRQIRWVHSIR